MYPNKIMLIYVKESKYILWVRKVYKRKSGHYRNN